MPSPPGPTLHVKENIHLFNELLDAAEVFGGDHEIIEDIERKLTYKELIAPIYVLSSSLGRLLRKENRVGLLLPNSIGHVVALFSLFRLGITPAVLNFSMGSQSLSDCCETASLQVILTSRQFMEKAGLQELTEALQAKHQVYFLEDIRENLSLWDKMTGYANFLLKAKSKAINQEVILFTSGSEDKPKGVILTHANFYANVKQALSVIEVDPKKDIFFNVLPMFHSFGLMAGTILPLISGMKLYTYPSPLHYREIPSLIREKKATILFGTSTFLENYGKHAKEDDFRTLRYVLAGAEKLKEKVANQWKDQFGIHILEGYGTTETAPVLSLNTPTYSKPGTVGKLLPNIEYRIEPVEGINRGGRLLVKGPNVMKGYLIHEKGFIPASEWYDTGDVAEVDSEGYVTILSRLKRFAKIAGEMVSLNLLEHLAMECFKDSGFFAVSIPGDRKGEKIILFTTKERVEGKELRRCIQANKQNNLLMPSKIQFVEEIPVLGSGKTNYVELTEMAKALDEEN